MSVMPWKCSSCGADVGRDCTELRQHCSEWSAGGRRQSFWITTVLCDECSPGARTSEGSTRATLLSSSLSAPGPSPASDAA